MMSLLSSVFGRGERAAPGKSSAAAAPEGNIVIEARDVVRVLGGKGVAAATILQDINLAVPRGQFVALTGASGSGKSTLLYLLGALDRATSGTVWLEQTDIGLLDDDARAQLRNECLGFVFQFHFLLPELTVLENVFVPMLRRGVRRDVAEQRAYETLAMLGIAALANRKPGQLSGGEQQRVAIARAIANEPSVILADEPTGSLDSRNADLVIGIFERLAREDGKTIIMVTHDRDFAARADRQVVMKDGRIVEDEIQRPDLASGQRL